MREALKTAILGVHSVHYSFSYACFSERQFFYIREQDKMSFTALLISLIFQKYKIGFKVELKYIKVMVKERAVGER